MARRALHKNIRHSFWLALALAGCATPEGSTTGFDSSSAGSASVAGSSAGKGSSAGMGGSSDAGSAGQQTLDEGGSAAGPDTTNGGGGSGGTGASAGSQGGAAAAGRGGSAGSVDTGSGGKAGGAGSGGASGNAGNAGTTGGAGTDGAVGGAGAAGGAGTAGGAGGTAQVLSQGKASSADSEQTIKGNLAGLGNDGSAATRWCAADGAVGHHWQVDLGASHTLGKLEVTWEKAAVYKFKVEGSPDGATWALLLDQTNSSNAASDQTYTLTSAPSARWVRITVTGLANSTTWASFFEFSVSGY